MEQNLLRRGQTVILETVQDERIWRYAFIVDFVLPQQIFLTPLSGGDIISLYEPERPICGYIPTPTRTYKFESKVLQTRRSPTPHIVIELPERIEPVQRRRFFRVRALLSVRLLPLSGSDEPCLEQPIEGYGTDISGGGVGVRVNLQKLPKEIQLQQKQRVRLDISLPTIEKNFPNGLTFETVGEIVWTKRNGRTMRLGISFTDIDRKVQQQVISWCFAYQRRLIQLGLLDNNEQGKRRV